MRLLTALVLVLAGLVATPAPTASAAGFDLRDAHGIQVRSVRTEGRLVRVVVSTSALARPVRVNVLLPQGYTDSRRYPSYYLFHGTSGGADDWVELGGVREATRGRDLITVMPDAGYDGNGGSWFTDWLDQGTALGAARWETFHVEQLIPWVDANFRTIRNRNARAIAGLSQGGFGAFSYAARHPDRFVAAASFSGAPDIARNPLAKQAATAVVAGTMTGLNGVQPHAPFGDPLRHDVVWQGHNPATLVGNLRHADLRLWTGNGLPGPLDDPAEPEPAGPLIESITHKSTLFFSQAARRVGVRHVLRDYGPGTHTWPYWTRDLRQWLPRLEEVLDQRREPPRSVAYRSIDRRWSQWGWRVTARRAARFGWTGLAAARRAGFTLSGGSAVVTTPPRYAAGRRYAITYAGGIGPAKVDAGRAGRLRIDVRASSDAPVTVTIRRR